MNFRVNNSVVEPTYSDNAKQLFRIVSLLKEIEQDSTISLRKVSFCGSVSPEGNWDANRKLARARLQALETAVRAEVEIPDSIITRNDSYISWSDLEEEIIKSVLPHKEDIIEAIRQPLDDEFAYPTKRVAALRAIDDGRVWYQLLDLYFSHMRNASVIFTLDKQEITPAPIPIVTETPQPAQPLVVESHAKTEGGGFSPSISLKTNALAWGLAIANISAEIDFTNHWSLAIPLYYSAVNYFVSTIKFRTFASQPELRYWFKDGNTGLFAGAHFGVASYNIAVNGKYRFQDHNGNSPAIGGGISIGYRMPISKNERWNIEFLVGLGGYSIHYDKFYNIENGRLAGTSKRSYWGIDNAAINISYRFNLKKEKKCK